MHACRVSVSNGQRTSGPDLINRRQRAMTQLKSLLLMVTSIGDKDSVEMCSLALPAANILLAENGCDA